MNFLHGMAKRDGERYDALEKAGFNVERYGDIAHIMYERMGGHYMDVGTSAKIAKGLVSRRLRNLFCPPRIEVDSSISPRSKSSQVSRRPTTPPTVLLLVMARKSRRMS